MCHICTGWQDRNARGTDTERPAHGHAAPLAGAGVAPPSAPYALLPLHWPNRPGRIFTWSAQNFGSAQRDLVRRALNRWSAVSNLHFREVTSGGDIRFTRRHIDGSGGILGYESPWEHPVTNGFRTRSDITMDSGDWNSSDISTRFEYTLTHEIGHALGLGHSALRQAIMYAAIGSRTPSLHADDIAAIRALYGPNTARLPVWPSSTSLGNLTGLTSTRILRGEVTRASNEIDYLRFTLTAKRRLRFELHGLAQNTDLYLNHTTGRLIAWSQNTNNADDVFVRTLGPGTYYLVVKAAFSSGETGYRLRYGPEEGSTWEAAFNLGDLTHLAASRTQSGTVNPVDNDDYHRFTLRARRWIRFELRNLSADANLYLHDASRREIRSSRLSGTSVDSIVRELDPGTYYIRVHGRTLGTIRYRLHYRREQPGETSESAFNLGDLTNATRYRTRAGSLNQAITDDVHYRFTLGATRTIRFELRNLSLNADLYLQNASGRVLRSSRRSGTSVDSILRELAPGTYYIRVHANAPGNLRYQLRYRREIPGGAPDVAFDLGDLTSANTYRARVGSVNQNTNDNDYYRFTLGAMRTVRFELRNLSADANLFLQNAALEVLQSSRRSGTSVDSIVRELGPGTYYVRVDAHASAVRYQLRYREQTPPGANRERAWDLGDLALVPASRTRSGTVHWRINDNDYRRFTLSATRLVRFELHRLSANADLYLEDASGQVLRSSTRSDTSADVIVQELARGTYYVRVDAHPGGHVNYRLRYQAAAAGTVIWAATNLGNLTDSTAYRTESGTVEWATNRNDYRRFTLSATRAVRFELRDLSANADLYLEDASGKVLQSSILPGTADDSIIRTLRPGTYHIRVAARTSRSVISYKLRYQAAAPGAVPWAAINLGDLTDSTDYRTQSDTVERTTNGNDYRVFTLTRWRTMHFELRGLSANADLYLQGANLEVLDSSTRSGAATDTIARELAPGTYYIRVDANDGGTIHYQLRYRRSPDPARGASRQTAWYIGNLTLATEYRTKSGSVHSRSNASDFYRFQVTAAHAVRLELQNLSSNADLYLEDAAGRVLRSSTRSGTATDSIFGALRPGTYYVRIDARASGSLIHYQLRYRRGPNVGQSPDVPFHLGDLTGSPAPRTRSDKVDGQNNDSDYYRFALTANHVIRFELLNLSANADLYLLSANLQELRSSTRSGTAVDSIIHELPRGTYYIRVDASAGGTIRYQLRYRAAAKGTVRWAAHILGDLTNATADGLHSGRIVSAYGRNQYYRFTLSHTRTMRFWETAPNAVLHLEDASGAELQSPANIARREPGGVAYDLGPGTYYIRVSGDNDASYQLGYSMVGMTRRSAYLLTFRSRDGTVEREGNDSDYYYVNNYSYLGHLPFGAFYVGREVLTIDLHNLSADANLYVERAGDAPGAYLRSENSGTSPDWIRLGHRGGKRSGVYYYVRVDAAASGEISYRLSVRRFDPDTTNVENLGDLTNATAPRTRRGRVGYVLDDERRREYRRDDDYYRFALTETRTISFSLRSRTSGDADTYMNLESVSGEVLDSLPDGSGRSVLGPGVYYLRVFVRYGLGRNNYELFYSAGNGAGSSLSATAPAEVLAASPAQRAWRDDALSGGLTSVAGATPALPGMFDDRKRPETAGGALFA